MVVFFFSANARAKYHTLSMTVQSSLHVVKHWTISRRQMSTFQVQAQTSKSENHTVTMNRFNFTGSVLLQCLRDQDQSVYIAKLQASIFFIINFPINKRELFFILILFFLNRQNMCNSKIKYCSTFKHEHRLSREIDAAVSDCVAEKYYNV